MQMDAKMSGLINLVTGLMTVFRFHTEFEFLNILVLFNF